MKKNIFYALSIALLLAAPCATYSMEHGETHGTMILKEQLTQKEKDSLIAFQKAMDNDDWKRAQFILNLLKGSAEKETDFNKKQILKNIVETLQKELENVAYIR